VYRRRGYPRQRHAGGARAVLRRALADVAAGDDHDPGAIPRRPGLRAQHAAGRTDPRPARAPLGPHAGPDAGRADESGHRPWHPLPRPPPALRDAAEHRVRGRGLARLQPLADGRVARHQRDVRGGARVPTGPDRLGRRDPPLRQARQDGGGLPADGGGQPALGSPKVRPDLRGGAGDGPGGRLPQRDAGIPGLPVPDGAVREPLRPPGAWPQLRDDGEPDQPDAHRRAGPLPAAASRLHRGGDRLGTVHDVADGQVPPRVPALGPGAGAATERVHPGADVVRDPADRGAGEPPAHGRGDRAGGGRPGRLRVGLATPRLRPPEGAADPAGLGRGQGEDHGRERLGGLPAPAGARCGGPL
ncbi:MAG: hypothetical protein AVDCRST_MAG21-1764, partial [uncultured Nocardioidaceae bacterium]